MISAKDMLPEEDNNDAAADMERILSQPAITEIAPPTILKFTKQNVAAFHQEMRPMILGGYGMFEYLEAIQFFCKLKEVVFGVGEKEGDKEFLSAVMEEIAKHGKEFVSPRGVKFELAETGTRYDYSQNAEWMELNLLEKSLGEKRKALEEKLKKIPAGSALADTETGETLIGPPKTSKSSFKIVLPK